MVSPAAALNRILWSKGNEGLVGVVIAYRHRGAPNDTAFLRGEGVAHVGRTFLDLPDGVRLPMHRILRIEHDGRVVWDRAHDARPRTMP